MYKISVFVCTFIYVYACMVQMCAILYCIMVLPKLIFQELYVIALRQSFKIEYALRNTESNSNIFHIDTELDGPHAE